MTRLRPLAIAALVGLLSVLAMAAAVRPTAADDADPRADADTVLAERYAPVMYIAPSDDLCKVDDDYLPAPVDIVLTNPAIALRERGRAGEVLQGPTAYDLADLGTDFYLDYPGDPTGDRCVYAVDGDRLMQGREPVVYAIVTHERGRPGLALQYWFYYYFDTWLNTHEGDWEMIQLVFRAGTAEEALRQQPVEIDYAQHGGGERAGWGDSKLRRQGVRPEVYVGPGSHASYYAPKQYFGIGGCEDLSSATRRVDPRVEVLAGPGDPVPVGRAWETFRGQWGDPRGGPQGPMPHEQWSKPMSWQDTLSSSAIVMPKDPLVGPGIAGVFCPVGRLLGSANIGSLHYPPLLPVGLIALLVGSLTMTLRTHWRSIAHIPLRARRPVVDIVMAAAALYARHPAVFLPIGLVPLPLATITALLGYAVPDDQEGVASIVAALLGPAGLLLSVIAVGMVQSSTVAAVDDLANGGRPTALGSMRRALRRLVVVVLAMLGTGARVVLYAVTLIGAPWAVKRNTDWAFTVQLATLGGGGPRSAWRGSRRLVRGSWWRIFLLTTATWALGLALPVVIGLPLLPLFAGTPELVELIGILVYGLFMPLATIVVTLLYYDRAAVAAGAV